MARFGLSMFRRVRRFQFRCFARKRFGKQETKSFGRFLLSGQSPDDAVKSENTTAIDWRRESPLLQHFQLGDVVFIVQPRSAATAKDNAFANLGYEILAQGPRGPLIVERTDEMMLQKLDYLHHNPVKRGLVASPEHWRYSSAHERFKGAEAVLKCDAWK